MRMTVTSRAGTLTVKTPAVRAVPSAPTNVPPMKCRNQMGTILADRIAKYQFLSVFFDDPDALITVCSNVGSRDQGGGCSIGKTCARRRYSALDKTVAKPLICGCC